MPSDEDDGHHQNASHHHVATSKATRVFFTVIGAVGLVVLGVVSYHTFRDTGTTGGDVWFVLHVPAYLVTAGVCVGLLRAGLRSSRWHTFATEMPPAAPAEDPWSDD